MAKFTASVPLKIRLPGGFEIDGAVGATHRIPDSLVEEFTRDQVPLIPGGVTWVSQDETSQIVGFDPSTKYDKTGGTISGSTTVTGTLGVGGAVTLSSTLGVTGVATFGSVIAAAVTATSARFKGSPTFDVRAYGATGDGTTDDLAAFNIATVACSAAGGGTIYVPKGSYSLSNQWAIDVPSVHVELDPGAVVFTSAPTTSGATIWFVRDTTAGIAVTPQNAWASIRGGTVSNSGSTTLDNAIGFTRVKFAVCEQVRIPASDRKAISAQAGVDHVRFINNNVGTCKMGGITVESNIGDVHIIGNYIASAGAGQLDQTQAAAILVEGTITEAYIARNVIGACGSFGIRSTSTTRLRIEDNTLPNCPSNGISIVTGVGVEIVRNRVVSGKIGIALTSTSGVILLDGNEITAGGTTANTYDAMYFDTCTSRPVLRSNKVLGTNHRYAAFGATMTSYPVVSTGNQLITGGTGIYGGTLTLGMVADLVDGLPMFAGYGVTAGVALHVVQGTAAPVSGTWLRGDICWNTAPSAGGTPGWVCTTAGTPGTWKAMAVVAA